MTLVLPRSGVRKEPCITRKRARHCPQTKPTHVFAALRAAELMLASNVKSAADKMDNLEDAEGPGAAAAGAAVGALKAAKRGEEVDGDNNNKASAGAPDLKEASVKKEAGGAAAAAEAAAAAGDVGMAEGGKAVVRKEGLAGAETARSADEVYKGQEADKMVTPLPTVQVVYSTPAAPTAGDGRAARGKAELCADAPGASGAPTTTPLTVPRQRRNARALPTDDEGVGGGAGTSRRGLASVGDASSLPSPSKQVVGEGQSEQPPTPGTRAGKRKQGQLEPLQDEEKLPGTPAAGHGEGTDGGRRTSDRKRGKRGEWPSSPSSSKALIVA